MDRIKVAIQSPVFAGFVRALIAYGCGWCSKHGLHLGQYELPLACGVIMLLDMWWSKKDKCANARMRKCGNVKPAPGRGRP